MLGFFAQCHSAPSGRTTTEKSINSRTDSQMHWNGLADVVVKTITLSIDYSQRSLAPVVSAWHRDKGKERQRYSSHFRWLHQSYKPMLDSTSHFPRLATTTNQSTKANVDKASAHFWWGKVSQTESLQTHTAKRQKLFYYRFSVAGHEQPFTWTYLRLPLAMRWFRFAPLGRFTGNGKRVRPHTHASPNAPCHKLCTSHSSCWPIHNQ